MQNFIYEINFLTINASQNGDTRCTAPVVTAAIVDYESVAEFDLIITVTDGDGMNLAEYVQLSVLNENEAPEVSTWHSPKPLFSIWATFVPT